MDEHEALRTCLHAVKTGILNLSWAMMCPNCRVSKLDTPSLSGLSDQIHCDLCGVGFGLNFDRYVELRFAVHPAVRRAEAKSFCTSGPFSTPHILMQKCLEPGQTADFSTLQTSEPLRLRVLRLNALYEIPAPKKSTGCVLMVRLGTRVGRSQKQRSRLLTAIKSP